jgi:DNA-directed RNA polymerase specialized sigma24 family protein
MDACGDIALHRPLDDDQLKAIEPLLHQMAVKYSRCEADRLDCVQAAYLHLLANQSKLDDWPELAKRAMLDHRGDDDFWYEQLPLNTDFNDPPYLPDDPLVLADLRQFNGVDVDPLHKEAATMYWLDNKSQREIADHMSVCVTTVRNWLENVRQALHASWYGLKGEEESK